MDARQKVEEFFAAYAARMNRALGDPPEEDAEATVTAFATCFIEASPEGVKCGQNNAEFKQAIPMGLQFYRSIGTKAMTIRATEITQIDEIHWMAKVSWGAHYEPKDGRKFDIDFDVTYLLQLKDDQPKIFCYVTGDEQQAYREHGLVPG